MGLMVSTLLKLAALLILLGLTNASPDKFNFGHCEKIVKRWASSAVNQEAKADAHTLRDLLFFLHVPRTGGRTYFHCFLKKLYSNSQECPRSYDKLRFDPSKAKCRLLVNHDDYSMMSKLPDERTSVVTILRNPVDRVFSTYEFSVEVAARFLVHPNLTSATNMARRLRAKTKGVSTLDIWPWKYLVPWMREDLFARRDARRRNGPIEVEGNDPYDMEEMVMPLHDYINDPIARDIIHNGATFQVAGLTNNSYFTDAHEVRHCIMQYKELGDYALAVAKKRLDNMLYVGLTEEHRESATMFANVVGAQVISQLKSTKPGAATAAAEETSEQSTILDPEPDDGQSQNTTSEQENGISTPGNAETGKGNMTVNKLMGAYESCISTLRKSQSRRRVTSLKHIAPANFTKEARLHVSAAVLREIKSLNSLDLELYEYAQEIFAKQHSLSNQKLLTTESFGGIISSSYSITPWNLVLLASPLILLVLFIFAFVRARRTSKIKI
ncbi:protein-tyrosine sulfotransferase isoform X1 [Punica granatum]|uniref:Protein-tyrosine sulfotransferase isoform X1 n=1 Tax=Punica granatum TaxID=22663 RepID=A0A6P8CP71_PUNGR|nr:protein-tyrosine sulfotransferase isoform X1 [Punica granatum]